MGSQEILYDNIERYLAGSLSEAELKDFEAKLKADETLRSEVNLHRDLSRLLADSPEDSFRENLKKLGSRLKESETTKGENWKYLLLLLPVLLFAGWWLTRSDSPVETLPNEIYIEKNQPIVPTKKMEETGPDLENLSPKELKEIEKEAKQPIKKIEPKKATKTPIKFADDSKKETTSTLLAVVDFEPNPSLEFLVENNRRGGEIEFTPETKPNNVKLKKKDQAVDFHFSGAFESELDLKKKAFKIHIFSNKKSDYKNFLPVISGKVDLVNHQVNHFRFNFRKAIVLKPGLYYYLLEDAETEELFYVEKFEVR